MVYKINTEARCAVIGYGSWATALMKILLENESRVGWHIRNPQVLEHIRTKGSNPRYLRDVRFPRERIDVSSDINQVVDQADIVILAVPSAFLKDTLAPMTVSLQDKFVISAIKGIIPDEYITVAEYLNQHYHVPYDRIGILSGPCHAEEVALEKLSYLTMVCKNIDNARILSHKIATDYLHVNPSTDIYGTEYAAVLKNIYAIGVGIALGLGYGDNFTAVLISNAAIEMSRFLAQSYAFERDTCASVYLGDLLVTCYSQFSRNRTFGVMIGRGYSIKSAQVEMKMVAEGYYASECIMQINKRFGIDMPIAECVHRILYGGAPAAQQMEKLTMKLI